MTATSSASSPIRGELHAAGRSVALEVSPYLRTLGGELAIDAETRVDQCLLGIPAGRLTMTRAPSKLVLRGILVAARLGMSTGRSGGEDTEHR